MCVCMCVLMQFGSVAFNSQTSLSKLTNCGFNGQLKLTADALHWRWTRWMSKRVKFDLAATLKSYMIIYTQHNTITS